MQRIALFFLQLGSTLLFVRDPVGRFELALNWFRQMANDQWLAKILRDMSGLSYILGLIGSDRSFWLLGLRKIALEGRFRP